MFETWFISLLNYLEILSVYNHKLEATSQKLRSGNKGLNRPDLENSQIRYEHSEQGNFSGYWLPHKQQGKTEWSLRTCLAARFYNYPKWTSPNVSKRNPAVFLYHYNLAYWMY